MNSNTCIVNKKIGETMTHVIHRARTQYTIPDTVPCTYAGRLDPLASGKVLILYGDAVHEKEKYLTLEKIYTVQFIIGIETDSYDILGKQIIHTKNASHNNSNSPIHNKKIHTHMYSDTILKKNEEYFEYIKNTMTNSLKKIVGNIEQQYPPYSADAYQVNPYGNGHV
jgi:tRNA U55 pseudouridine synthase TruB